MAGDYFYLPHPVDVEAQGIGLKRLSLKIVVWLTPLVDEGRPSCYFALNIFLTVYIYKL